MTMRRGLAVPLALALALGAAGSAPAKADAAAVTRPAAAPRLLDGGAPAPARRPGLAPDLAAQLRSAHPTDQLAVVAVLRSQADVAVVRAGSRRDRIAGIEQRLRETADRGQRSLVPALRAAARRGSVTRVVPLWIADEVAFTATPAVIRAVAGRPDVREVLAEQTVQASALASTTAVPSLLRAGPAAAVLASTTDPAPEPNVAQVGAPALWAQGLRGQGVVVASLDTGVDVTHPDLAASWRGGSNSWYDPNGQHPTTPTDISGHGTQTLGVIVGGSAGGTAIGVAPGATWIAAKIFNDRGTATTTAIHQAYQWLLDPDHNPATADAPNVVNDSWTMSSATCTLEFQPDLRALRAAGIVPVFAAGNSGPTSGSVLSPANLPEALAVGSVDSSDVVDPASGRGPSACTQAVEPGLTAPGVGIRTTDLYGGYVQVSGTSLAAPHAAGVLALVLSGAPGTSADRQVAALESGGFDLGTTGPDDDYGFGRLDAAGAYQWLRASPDFSLTASASSASTPSGGSGTFSVTAVPVNGFAGDVALSLSGLTSSQATWSITPATIVGGNGNAMISVTTAPGLAPGSYPLTVTGNGGALTHTVALTLVVTAPPDFGLAVSPSSVTVAAGGAGTAAVTISSTGGFGGSVALGVSGLPATVGTATVAPASVPGGGSAQVTVQVAAGAAAGSYPLTVSGSSGSLSHSSPLTLVVPAPADFSLAASPTSVSVTRTLTARYAVTVTANGAFSGTVTLSVSGLPSGASASWSPNPLAGAGKSTLQVRTSSATPRGRSTLTITGVSGGVRHQVTVTLTVT